MASVMLGQHHNNLKLTNTTSLTINWTQIADCEWTYCNVRSVIRYFVKIKMSQSVLKGQMRKMNLLKCEKSCITQWHIGYLSAVMPVHCPVCIRYLNCVDKNIGPLPMLQPYLLCFFHSMLIFVCVCINLFCLMPLSFPMKLILQLTS